MKAATAIGIVVACLGLALGSLMEGSNPMAVLNPPAMLIVLVGTFGVTLGSCGMEAMKNIPSLYKKAFAPEPLNLNARLRELVGYAEKARRDGLLALDQQLSEVSDDYTRKGLQLVVDGTDADLVADILEAENEAMRKRHAAGAAPFEKAGGFAPTMGIIGTVFGLISVMENLDKPETLGPAIAVAFIATLIGVASANVFFLPIANRLKGLSQAEMHFREMTMEGILAIQAGDNPRVVAEKLGTYVPPSERTSTDGEAAADDSTARQAA